MKHLLCVCVSEWLPCFHINASGGGEAELIEAEKERKKKTAGSSGVPEGLSVDLLRSFIVDGGRLGAFTVAPPVWKTDPSGQSLETNL